MKTNTNANLAEKVIRISDLSACRFYKIQLNIKTIWEINTVKSLYNETPFNEFLVGMVSFSMITLKIISI